MQKSQEIERTVSAWLEGVSRRDPTAVAELISSDENALVIGTDPDEWWAGHDRIVDIFAKQL